MNEATCTNIHCGRTKDLNGVQFAGVGGTYMYCDEHYQELKQIEETYNE